MPQFFQNKKRVAEKCCCNAGTFTAAYSSASARKGGEIFMKVVKIIALCAFAVTAFGLTACASKKSTAPAAPATTVKYAK